MNFQNMAFKFLVLLAVSGCVSGCASTSAYHTQQESDERLMSHYYNADYDAVMNGAAEAAASVINWEIESVEMEKGFINVKDQTTWGTYVRKIKVEKMSEKRMKVDILTYAPVRGNYRGLDKEQVAAFFANLDGLIPA